MTMRVDIPKASAARMPKCVMRNRILIGWTVAHAGAAFFVSQILCVPFELKMFNSLMMMCFLLLPVTLAVLAIGYFAYLAVVVRPKKPIHEMVRAGKYLFLDKERMATGALSLFLFVFFVGSFTFLKGAIPLLVPFSWDQTFAEWDRALHFGVDPYKLVLAAFGTPVAATLINVAYHLWFFLMYFLLIFACFTKMNRQAAYTFLVSTVAVWFVGGNVMATFFSSAGPVYFERLGLGADFVPLMDALHRFNETGVIWALDVHELLWEGYVAEGQVNGISAMPSMHVASTVLMTCYAYSFGRWAGHAMSAFLVVIMIGSVLLAWHYAVDSYLGALIAVAGWYCVKRFAVRDTNAA